MKCKGRFTLVLFALLVLAVQPSKADSFSVGIGCCGSYLANGFSQGSGPSPTPVSVSQSVSGPIQFTFSVGSATAGASASAAAGQLRLGANSTLNLPTGTFNGANVGAAGNATFSMDFVLSGPQGTTGMLIPVTFNTVLTGSFGANASGAGGMGGVLSGGASAGLCSAAGTCGSSSLGQLYADSGGGFSASGVFGGLGVPLASPIYQVHVGDTFTVTMGFDLSTLAFANNFTPGAGSANAFADFIHTLGFPTSGPVFNLPTGGYTVNSLDGTVVNNQFTPVGTVVPTPEPNTLLLMGSGFFALGGRIALRRKRALKQFLRRFNGVRFQRT
jgi:hypothetical protein